MRLLHNSLVFLDTGPFKDFDPSKSDYAKLLEYASSSKIIVCTSWLCIEEWASQKQEHYVSCCRTIKGDLDNLVGRNFFAAKLLDRATSVTLMDEAGFKSRMRGLLDSLIRDHKICVFDRNADHAEKTWNAYFDCGAPFSKRKQRADIPDSWIYECAVDAAVQYQNTENKYVISSENNQQGKLPNFLQEIGYKVITLTDLLKELAAEESGTALPEALIVSTDQAAPAQAPTTDILSGALRSFVGSSYDELATRILGYSHWFKAPSRDFLRTNLRTKGHQTDEIEACSQLLSFGPDAPITLTNDNYIPRKIDICQLAAEKVRPEVLAMLAEGV